MGSDGSVKDGCGAHVYEFTSNKIKGKICVCGGEGGAPTNPGAPSRMSSFRAEHKGAIRILLVVYAIEMYMKKWSTYEAWY